MNVQKHGIGVEVMLGKWNRPDQYSAADFLANSGIPTRIDAQYGIAHNNKVIIDGARHRQFVQ
jgi:hypothetical protein